MAVYFIRAGDNGPVKIGTAIDVSARLSELQCGNHKELRVLRVIPGGYCEESFLHRIYAARAIRGEWFEFTEEMLTKEISVLERERTPFQAEIAAIEKRLAESGKTIDDLCEAAGINRTTWQRWRNGEVGPTMKSWQRVQEALPKVAA